MSAIPVIDDFGIWDDLGSVVPFFESWTTYPRYSVSKSSLIRLTFAGDLSAIQSFGYIRAIYILGNKIVKAPWVKVFPKAEQEYIKYPHPEEFNQLSISPQRYFEIQKRHYKRGYTGSFLDSVWSLNLQINNTLLLAEEFGLGEDLLGLDFI